ncbi:MAG: cytidine/deoxycytidylate deaminase family protein [Clostridia bacterium]|nr:cytidine/deoxycytidylate deaminase family protein [Clostridia bacterium]
MDKQKENQLKWDRRFMDIAKSVASWSSCVRNGRKVGSVIVRNNRILTTGYNGAPAGIKSCKERGFCLRDKLNIPSGTRAEMCYAIHAEQNAVIQAAKMGISVEGATIYVTHQPCSVCTRILINSGISRIVYDCAYPDEFSLELLRESGIELVHLPSED